MLPYKCSYCNKTFTQSTNMYRHRLKSCPANPHKRDISDSELDMLAITDDSENKSLVVIGDKDVDGSISNTLKQVLEGQKFIEKVLEAQDKKIEQLTKKPSSSSVFNIEKIQVFITEPVDFIDVLTKRLGNRRHAIDFIRSKLNKKLEGDVDIFCEIYLHGSPDTWSISCADKKNHIYRLMDPQSNITNDPSGIEIHKNFRRNYSNTLLKLSNALIMETINKKPGTAEHEKCRDELLDTYDLKAMQDKAYDLCIAPHDPFIKKLSVKIKILEKSYEIECAEMKIEK